ncbi:vitamin B12 ABC transporter ATP-binding protein BtuD [Pseudocitrobacter vendiensis]|uniref:Vitamin B12 import ATP-binding protein BtuD n=1 Tax=Pseudocitrobacter vendiensis TaxID=2488306 RepID=A0ABN8TEU1_9ENTR|nr:vitamin B12 ABC transporter ATP-binding protein BtuD [Pseudocitrobacter vendiensis]CAH6660014.1 Vitamin B12 import ATP-binding protein BtuD [Pseudocitrobacter vendiensis]
MTMLMQLQNVSEGVRLTQFSAEVHAGETIHLVGPNGAGKSTLLTRMAGLSSGKGTVTLNGKPLDEWTSLELAQKRAYLSQHQSPPFAMPVWHFLLLHQHDKTEHTLCAQVTEALGLVDKLGRHVNQLSGGEWQRVRLAAVILQIHPSGNPHGQLLLLDEPMNSLDVAQQAALDRVLDTLRARGIAIVMSSHDLNHTLRHANRVWLLSKGQSIASGTSAEVLTPDLLFSAYNISFQRLDIAGHQMLVAQ